MKKRFWLAALFLVAGGSALFLRGYSKPDDFSAHLDDESEFVRIQEGSLVDDPDAIEGKDVIAVYFSALWCAPCREFTPILSEFYDQASEKYPNFQLVLMSGDRDAEAMKEYMEWGEMKFPAVKYDKRFDSEFAKFAARGIPYLAVLNAEGKQILGRTPSGQQQHPAVTLAELMRLLDES